jgi:hypothetical protein
MVTRQTLEAETAIELPAREMLGRWSGVNVNIAVPIIIQNNINIQVCSVVNGNCNIFQGGQWNAGGIVITYP